MKLIVQIPCFNERDTLAATVAAIPREIPGVTSVEILVVDDGSDDGTADVARSVGVDHIATHLRNRGLAQAFETGIEACLRLGADIIVNTDADNQYDGSCIPDLIAPILAARADMVIGDRNPGAMPAFSRSKRLLQRAGSRVVARLADAPRTDAFSGFRAYSRVAAQRIHVMSDFSYTVETLIHAGRSGMAIESVPVRTNAVTRPSRLASSSASFIAHQTRAMIRFWAMHRALSLFATLGAALVLIGMIPFVRFLWFFATGDGDGHVQSLIFGLALLVSGALVLMFALIADLIASNRRLIEKCLRLMPRDGADSREASASGDRERQ